MAGKYTIGLDYGTNSVRALLVEVETGREISGSTYGYESGKKGIILDPAHPLLARHNPRDYLLGLESVVRKVLDEARSREDVQSSAVIGIGIDTTGSTPIPVDRQGLPLSFSEVFADNPDAYAWLWKDHTATAEAEEITRLAKKIRPAYLGKVGGAYSSEWLWSKLLRCRRCAPDVFSAAWSWVEMCDWIPATLSGDTRPEKIRRGVCAAGHKALYHPQWGGWPDADFLTALDPELARIASTFAPKAFSIGEAAGFLCREWAERLGLPAGIPIAVGAFDAHLGGVGAGIA
ncbi:MAG TPA: FGGY family carbohydrate kinase, partial [Rectinemataceae bacterium]|nr:FGGY family carbohydrate kinase [Rectinemataceae bacterium]